MSSKKCNNCGADNDPLFSNCQFCKTPLPIVDLNSISNEDLILNAGEWIGKISNQGFEVSAPDSNMWTQRGIRRYLPPEIEGYAQRYLTLLDLRAKNNYDLRSAYLDLKQKFDQKSKSLSSFESFKKKLIVLLILLPILGIGTCTYIVLKPTEHDIEIKRLNSIENKVIESIKENNLPNAKLLLNSLEYSIHWSGNRDSIEINSWKRRRENYLITIEELEKTK